MTTLAEHRLPDPWVEHPHLEWCSHAAHAGWIHREAGAVVLKFWMADEVNTPRSAYWLFEVRHKGVRRQAWTCQWGGPADMGPVLQSAESVMRKIEVELEAKNEQAR